MIKRQIHCQIGSKLAYSLCCLSASLSFLDASWWSKSELRLTMADFDERALDRPRDSTTVLNYRLISFSNSRGKVCRVGTSLLDSTRGSRIEARLRLFSRFTAGAERGSPPNVFPLHHPYAILTLGIILSRFLPWRRRSPSIIIMTIRWISSIHISRKGIVLSMMTSRDGTRDVTVVMILYWLILKRRLR